MCNAAAALGVGLLLLMSGRPKQKQSAPQQMSAPMPSTNYSSGADSLASTNEGLAEDSTGSPSTSSSVITAKKQSPGAANSYRNSLQIPTSSSGPRSNLPTIGSLTKQKPVNY